MQLFRILTIAFAITLSLTGCRRNPKIAENCGEPSAAAAAPIVILVNDNGTVDPADERRYVDKRGQLITWRLKNPDPPRKELDIKLSTFAPPRFVGLRGNASEKHANRNPSDQPRRCEEHPYDIIVTIDGKKVPGDPILIIRD